MIENNIRVDKVQRKEKETKLGKENNAGGRNRRRNEIRNCKNYVDKVRVLYLNSIWIEKCHTHKKLNPASQRSTVNSLNCVFVVHIAAVCSRIVQ